MNPGSGKTLIAVLLLKWVIDQELEDRALSKPHRISFFLVRYHLPPTPSSRNKLLISEGQVDCVTLVFQQHAVLECNLDQKIDRFCGDMGCDLWSREVWKKHFSANMAIVCTAEVLHQCLMHGFITIDQINILIFDEAHHTKKNHAYARYGCTSFAASGQGGFTDSFALESSKISTYQRNVLRRGHAYSV